MGEETLIPHGRMLAAVLPDLAAVPPLRTLDGRTVQVVHLNEPSSVAVVLVPLPGSHGGEYTEVPR